MEKIFKTITNLKEAVMATTQNVTIEYHHTWIDISAPENAETFQYGTPEFPEIPIHPDPVQAVRDALGNPRRTSLFCVLQELTASGVHMN
jgi:hypothetical protein